MGLAAVVRKERAREGRVRVLVLGLDGAGKSSVVARWRGFGADAVRTVAPTHGFRIWSVPLSSSGTAVTVWDVGGQRGLRAYWRNYFEATDGLVFVIDAAAPSRLAEAAAELRGLLVPASVSVAVLANKADLCSGDGVLAGVASAVAPLFAPMAKASWRVFATSALTNEGVHEALSWLYADIARRRGFACIRR